MVVFKQVAFPVYVLPAIRDLGYTSHAKGLSNTGSRLACWVPVVDVSSARGWHFWVLHWSVGEGAVLHHLAVRARGIGQGARDHPLYEVFWLRLNVRVPDSSPG